MQDRFGLIGQTLQGQFRVDAVAGEGGFGVVYRGFHLSFEHPIAIKCLKVPSHFTMEAQALFEERFREEGKVLSKLSQHPSIVRVFDFGLASTPVGKVPFLVLEWLEGQDLAALLAARLASGGPFSEREAIALLRPAIDALAVAHRLGVAHRDLKPANLYLARTALGETVKVLDFGIAKAMQEGDTATQAATQSQSLFRAFSPSYGAPEQFYAKRFGATGPWTDVHALGLILVEMVTGRTAFEGDELTEWLHASLSPTRPTPRARGVAVSDAFEAVCARAIALEPRDRFASATELLDALDRALASPEAPRLPPTVALPAAISSTATTPLHVTPPHVTPPHVTPPHITPPAHVRSRQGTSEQGSTSPTAWLAIGGGALALLLVAGATLGWALQKPTEEPSPEPTAPSGAPAAPAHEPGEADAIPGGDMSAVLRPEELGRDTGTVFVTSSLDDVTLWVDGVEHGPLSRPLAALLQPGPRRLEARRGSTVLAHTTIEVEAGGQSTVVLDPPAAPPPVRPTPAPTPSRPPARTREPRTDGPRPAPPRNPFD